MLASIAAHGGHEQGTLRKTPREAPKAIGAPLLPISGIASILAGSDPSDPRTPGPQESVTCGELFGMLSRAALQGEI
jgi:hypothetical protein